MPLVRPATALRTEKANRFRLEFVGRLRTNNVHYFSQQLISFLNYQYLFPDRLDRLDSPYDVRCLDLICQSEMFEYFLTIFTTCLQILYDVFIIT